MASKMKEMKSSLGNLLTEINNIDDSAPRITPKKQHQSLLAASAGKRKQIAVISVDPNRCKLWDLHNREQEFLNTESCSDLIESIKLNGQIEPALAREIYDNPDYDFEIIYGSRRRYACKMLGKDLQITITTANDRECAALMDAENRARQDISDYERALDYKKWLDARLYNTQKDLADGIGMDPGNLNKLMKLTELPEYIIQAFKSPLDIKAHYAPELLKVILNKNISPKVEKKIEELKAKKLEGIKVYKALLNILTEKTKANSSSTHIIRNVNGEILFTFKKKRASHFELIFNSKQSISHLSLIKEQVFLIIEDNLRNN